MLNICEPEERRGMYDALMPNLRFHARPLEAYVTEWREQAETRQLPVVQPDGTLRAYNVPEIVTEVQALVAEAVAKYHLIVVCRRCTIQGPIPSRSIRRCCSSVQTPPTCTS